MKNQASKHLRLSDFYLAAYLRASGAALADIDKSNPRRVIFVFEDFEGRDELERDFTLGRSQVEPKKFATAIRELKRLMYDEVPL